MLKHTVPVENIAQLHILLVDNNPITLEKKALLLEGFGCLVTCSTNGIEANILIKANPDLFHIVMTDYSVPGMSQIESETSPAETPVVMYLDKNVFIDEKFIADMPFKMLN